MRDAEDCSSKGMFFDAFWLEVFDEEEEGDYALLKGEELYEGGDTLWLSRLMST